LAKSCAVADGFTFRAVNTRVWRQLQTQRISALLV